MFFPPSVMMISLILPVIFKKPSASMLPKSPDLYQKSSENASFVFTSSYNFGKVLVINLYLQRVDKIYEY